MRSTIRVLVVTIFFLLTACDNNPKNEMVINDKFVGMQKKELLNNLGQPAKITKKYEAIGLKPNTTGANETHYYKSKDGHLYVYYKNNIIHSSKQDKKYIK